MKTKKEEMAARSAYKRYTTQFKEQALERADRDGITKVAQDLGIAEATLYAWRAKRRQIGQPFEDQKLQQAEMTRLKRENARLEEEVAFLIPTRGTRKGGGVLRETAQVKYAMIKSNENQFSIGLMCRLLSVSRSGYYSWKQRLPSNRDRANQLLTAEIKRVFDDEKGRPGAPRIMRDNGWRAKAAKKYKATTNSKHSLPVAPNLLEQDFNADGPDQKWVSDITYIWTDEGWLYLAVVLDLYSRRVIGWAIAERMTATLACDALIMALWNRKMPKAVVVHSDRGSQYCSAVYQKLFRKHQLVCSMSKKGDCYDNAAMESWNHSFKVEAVHGERFKDRSDAKHQVFEYIEVYYNRKRLHSKLGYLSPDAFEAKKVA